MSKLLKAGLLLGLLVGPVLLFIFLRSFGTNRFDLPYYQPILLADGSIKMIGEDTSYYSITPGILSSQDTNNILEKSIQVVLLATDSSLIVSPALAVVADRFRNAFKEENTVTAKILVDPNLEGLVTVNNYWNKISDSILVAKLNHVFFPYATSGIGNYVNTQANLLLIDTEGRTRGFYDLRDTKDLERAFAEVRILIHQLSETDQ